MTKAHPIPLAIAVTRLHGDHLRKSPENRSLIVVDPNIYGPQRFKVAMRNVIYLKEDYELNEVVQIHLLC